MDKKRSRGEKKKRFSTVGPFGPVGFFSPALGMCSDSGYLLETELCETIVSLFCRFFLYIYHDSYIVTRYYEMVGLYFGF